MKSAKVTAFLSCSFSSTDAAVNKYFNSICAGLDIECKNVSDGYKETPPEKARELISESQLFVAVATRRDPSGDKFTMPHAVHDEISMAYAMSKPMLLFKESGVDFSKGFLTNYGTYVEFERNNLFEDQFLRKAVSSLHAIKLDVLSSNDLIPEQQSAAAFYAERMDCLYELKRLAGNFTWGYTIDRKLVFTDNLKTSIRLGAWTTLPPDVVDPGERIRWQVDVVRGSKSFKIETSVDRDTHQCIELSLKIFPSPEKGDTIELTQYFESPHLNKIFRTRSGAETTYMIGDTAFDCFDGVIPIMRIKNLSAQFRFPREYGLKKEHLRPIVGAYSAGIDYLVESELKRSQVDIRDFGGNITVDLSVESPLTRHVYGIAWSIPEHQNAPVEPRA